MQFIFNGKIELNQYYYSNQKATLISDTSIRASATIWILLFRGNEADNNHSSLANGTTLVIVQMVDFL